MTKKKIFFFILITLMLSSFLGLCIFEGILALLHKGEPYRDKMAGWKTWTLDDNHTNEANPFGFRGQHVNADVKWNVILIGDSYVETSHPLQEMPERYLKLGLEMITGEAANVVSIGSWGWGTDQQYLALKEYIEDIKPQYVLLWFTTNDYSDNCNTYGFGGFKPAFWLNADGLQGPTIPWMAPVKEYPLRILRILSRRGIIPSRMLRNEMFRSQYIDSQLSSAEEIECSDNTSVDFDLAKYYIDRVDGERWYAGEAASRKNSTHKFGSKYEQYYHDLYINPKTEIGSGNNMFSYYREHRPPMLDYGVKITNNLLNKINDLVKSHNARFLVFTFIPPKQAFENEPLSFCYKGAEYTYNLQNFNNMLEETFNGVVAYTVEGLPWDYKDDFDGHLSDKANQYVMKKVVEFMVTRWGEDLNGEVLERDPADR
mgnify:CR=1 FL=1|jgi:hypothetical protein